MDVTTRRSISSLPPRPSVSTASPPATVLHEAPKEEASEAHNENKEPAAVHETQVEPLTQDVSKPVTPLRPTQHILPVGAIVTALIAMTILSGITILIYLQS